MTGMEEYYREFVLDAQRLLSRINETGEASAELDLSKPHERIAVRMKHPYAGLLHSMKSMALYFGKDNLHDSYARLEDWVFSGSGKYTALLHEIHKHTMALTKPELTAVSFRKDSGAESAAEPGGSAARRVGPASRETGARDVSRDDREGREAGPDNNQKRYIVRLFFHESEALHSARLTVLINALSAIGMIVSMNPLPEDVSVSSAIPPKKIEIILAADTESAALRNLIIRSGFVRPQISMLSGVQDDRVSDSTEMENWLRYQRFVAYHRHMRGEEGFSAAAFYLAGEITEIVRRSRVSASALGAGIQRYFTLACNRHGTDAWELSVRIDDLRLDRRQAYYLLRLLSQLINNSLSHGMGSGNPAIYIALERRDIPDAGSDIQLSYRDNGPWYRGEKDTGESGSNGPLSGRRMGMIIATQTARAMQAEMYGPPKVPGPLLLRWSEEAAGILCLVFFVGEGTPAALPSASVHRVEAISQKRIFKKPDGSLYYNLGGTAYPLYEARDPGADAGDAATGISVRDGEMCILAQFPGGRKQVVVAKSIVGEEVLSLSPGSSAALSDEGSSWNLLL